MEKFNRLDYCKVCQHKKVDFKTGIICGLTGRKPDFEQTCPNFIEDKDIVFKRKKLDNKTKTSSGRSSIWYIIIIVVITFRVVRIFKRCSGNRQTTYTNSRYYNNERNNTKHLLKEINKVMMKSVISKKFHFNLNRFKYYSNIDSTFLFNKHLAIKINKGFNTSITHDNVPILAFTNGYYLIVEKVKKDKKLSILDQWREVRGLNGKLSDNISKKEKSIISVDYTLHYNDLYTKAVADLIEIGNERYFVELLSSYDKSHDYLRNYLANYYKIK